VTRDSDDDEGPESAALLIFIFLSHTTAVPRPSLNYFSKMEHEIDGWIEQLSQCKQLSEADVKKLCDKVCASPDKPTALCTRIICRCGLAEALNTETMALCLL
jgi:hypothetical protein